MLHKNDSVNKSKLKKRWIYLIPICVFFLAVIFILLTINVINGNTYNFDKYFLLLFRAEGDPTKPVGPEFLSSAVRDITAVGSLTIIAIIILGVSGFLLLKKEYRSFVYILFASIGGSVFANVLKIYVGRERPEIVTPLMIEYSKSFPSGHSVISAVVFLSLALLITRIEPSFKIRVYTLSVAAAAAFLVGVSRVYLGVHYPTDVIAGWILGLIWALICWYISLLLDRRAERKKGLITETNFE